MVMNEVCYVLAVQARMRVTNVTGQFYWHKMVVRRCVGMQAAGCRSGLQGRALIRMGKVGDLG